MRKERKLTLIRDELNCVLCYTFSSIVTIERRVLNENCVDDKKHNISEEHNVWCNNENEKNWFDRWFCSNNYNYNIGNGNTKEVINHTLK